MPIDQPFPINLPATVHFTDEGYAFCATWEVPPGWARGEKKIRVKKFRNMYETMHSRDRVTNLVTSIEEALEWAKS
jgi:hypothetical protein